MTTPRFTYSIIIPHKNIPDLLQRCLDSIPRRADVQVIVVDDNSDPATVDFHKLQGLSEEGVTAILDKTSRGAGHARNVGLESAQGKWMLFADADDFFAEGFLDVLDRYKDREEDVIYFTAESVDNETLQPIASRTIEATQMVRENNTNGLRYHHHVPWSKMVRASLIAENHLRFEEVEVSNDQRFSILIGLFAGEVLAVDAPIYISTVRSGSLYHNTNIRREHIRFSVTLRSNRLLIDNCRPDWRLNVFQRASAARQHSITTFLAWIFEAIRVEGALFVIKDMLAILRNKLK